jgi:hypothetical protein
MLHNLHEQEEQVQKSPESREDVHIIVYGESPQAISADASLSQCEDKSEVRHGV